MQMFLLCVVIVISIIVSSSSCVLSQQYPPVRNYRVAPGLGSRADQFVRITAVTPTTEEHSPEFNSFFTYSNQPFKYRWTNNKLFTTLKSITPSSTVPNQFSIGQSTEIMMQMVNVTVPPLGAGVKGIMAADICTDSDVANCETSLKEHLAIRLPTLLNTVMRNDNEITFWTIIGDNFYSPDGASSSEFFTTLAPAAKNKLFLTVPGNYDFWSQGQPSRSSDNSFGNGFMQLYGQDTMASKSDPDRHPFNFSINPDTIPSGSKHHDYLAATDNFLSYTAIGNIGFILADGAVHRHHMESFFQEACAWFASKDDQIAKIFVISHWVVDTSGCASNETTTYELYHHIHSNYHNAGCPGHKLRYFTGHHHCNAKLSDVGFIVGGFGKSNKHCRNFGLPFVDTTGGRLLVAYFPILHNDETIELDKLKAKREKKTARQHHQKNNNIGFGYPKKDHFRYQRLVGSATNRYNELIACSSLPTGLTGCVTNPNVEVEIWLNESLSD